MSPEFLLIRHAESEWNAVGRWQGIGDPSLSARGREQARQLSESLRGSRWDRLLCSDLLRARETAEALGAVVGPEPEIDSRLRELDVGDWTGLRRDEIVARDPDGLARFEAGDPHARPGGGESRSEIRDRARRFIEGLCRDRVGGRIAIVTHLGFIRALIPDAEPSNTDVHRIRGEDLLERRARAAAPSASFPSPL